MAEDYVIDLQHGWKKFGSSVGSNRRRLSRAMLRATFGFDPSSEHLRKKEFWALKDVNLKLKRGDALGLIGRNGAGKSTLLRVLGGHMGLDDGRVHVRGRVSELINLTAGYQPLLSGRENIKFGASLRGLTPKQIEDVTDEIIEFAEIGDFIEAPFGTYSNGMKLRLAFSVAVHVEPEILLIDEVIGVGDYGFRQKCMGRLQELREKCTILLCTHNAGHLVGFCDRVLVMEDGEVVRDGPPKEAVDYYLKEFESAATIVDDNTGSNVVVPPGENGAGPVHHDKNAIPITHFAWVDSENKTVTQYERGMPVRLLSTMRLSDDYVGRSLKFVVFLFNENGTPLARSATEFVPGPSGLVELELGLQAEGLTNSLFPTVVRVADGEQTLFRGPIPALDLRPTAVRPEWGEVRIPVTWMS